MKKLLTIAMITLAAMAAKADLYLYWTLDVGEFSNAYVAQIYGDDTFLGAMYVSSGATDTFIGHSSTDAYTNYWVALYDSAKNEIARNNEISYSDIIASNPNAIADYSDTSKPASDAYSFSGFTATIPEPTSGLMLLLGLGALALKRKVA